MSNYRLTGAVLIGTAMQLGVVYVPTLQRVFHTMPLQREHLGLALFVSTTAFFAVEAHKLVRRTRG